MTGETRATSAKFKQGRKMRHPKWEPRTREDRMLRSYLRRERRSGWLGAVHVEVPFGAPSGGT